MASLPVPGARADIPMMPMPVYPPNPGFMPVAEAAHINKVPVQPGRPALHAGHITAAVAVAPPQETVQHSISVAQNKPGAEQSAGDSSSELDPHRLKFWNPEETIELIQLYKKYLPEFHKFGQRKMNVWQRVTEEMVSKGYTNFSWAECSAKFRSLRDSYRRTTTGDKAHTWQYYPLMKEVMKMEKMILEQEPSTRPQKGTITCENEMRSSSLPFANASVVNAGLANAGMAASTLPIAQQPSNSRSEDGDGDVADSDMDDLGRKRLLLDTNGPAAKKSKESEQEEIVIGRNFNGEPVKAKLPKPLGALSSLQALGKSLSLPQSQLVVGEDGQVVQTTSAPTGLFVNDNGQLSHNQPTPARQSGSMPQWFKMYEKRTRAENNRRLEELKQMHQESLDLQRQTLEVSRQKNELLKNLMESLSEFKSLLQR
ncbi:uncharacterized protein [Littorina saxatilis]|uniref:Myb/SANT-like DNA-binding domain-containing protein n=1 Tax=Littorina saxatilis TaxID=31220 RepID=A0AAN9FW99_9CAEN